METIARNKPGLSPASVKAYWSTLTAHVKRNNLELSEVLNHPELIPDDPKKRRALLASILAYYGDNSITEPYKKMLANLTVTREPGARTLTNMVSFPEALEIQRRLEKVAKTIIKKGDLTGGDLQRIQDWVILSLYTLNPPRRSRDYTEMAIKDYDASRDNYYNGREFVFHEYKTSKSYGRQVIPVSPALQRVLRVWVQINPTANLLFTTSYEPLTSVGLRDRLNNIFGRRVSSNVLRHAYVTHYMKGVNGLEGLAAAMGHSIAEQQAIYNNN